MANGTPKAETRTAVWLVGLVCLGSLIWLIGLWQIRHTLDMPIPRENSLDHGPCLRGHNVTNGHESHNAQC